MTHLNTAVSRDTYSISSRCVANNLDTSKDYLDIFKLIFIYGFISFNDEEKE